MPVELKTECFILTTTLTTPLITAAAGEKIRITHIIASCGGTGGSITLKKVDTSKSTTVNLWNARAITANGNIEMFDVFLDGEDQLQGGYAGATDAHLSVDYQVLT
jgi:hypothetical protein